MKGRFAFILSYLGTNYHGWQIQPNANSIQETISQTMSKLHGSLIEVTGCGRTDTGVHARNYVAHADIDLPNLTLEKLQHKLNRMLPKDIFIQSILPVDDQFHARFDATQRMYRYYITFNKDPFHQETKYFFSQAPQCDWKKVEESAQALLGYSAFAPFCKSNSGLKHFKCDLFESFWEVNETEAIFQIRANRFLRGMVRLVVGMCLDIGLSKMKISELHTSMEKQTPLFKSWSVPAEGLFLEEIKYPNKEIFCVK